MDRRYVSRDIHRRCVGVGAFLFMMSVYLQGERHYSAVHTGLMHLPISPAALILSPIPGRLVGRFGSRPSLLAAGIMITTATLMLAGLGIWSTSRRAIRSAERLASLIASSPGRREEHLCCVTGLADRE